MIGQLFKGLVANGKSLADRWEMQVKSGPSALAASERVVEGEANAWFRAADAALVQRFGENSPQLQRYRESLDAEDRRIRELFAKGRTSPRGDWTVNLLLHAVALLAEYQYEQALSSGGPERDRTVANQPVRLFISHSSQDVQVAERLVDLIRAALNLPASAIRCTSVDGYRLPGGANTNEQLRREVHESETFIGIVSSESVRSMYVLFELGARWGAGKHLVPLLAPGTPTSALGGPMAGLNGLRCDNRAQLHQLLEELASKLSVSLQSSAAFAKHLDQLVGLQASASKGSADTAAIDEKSGTILPSPEHVRVLKLLAEAGGDGLTAAQLAEPMTTGQQKVQYYLDGLLRDDYIAEYGVSGEPTVYLLDAKGRSLLFERGLL